MPKGKLLYLGQIKLTQKVAEDCKRRDAFFAFVERSIDRHRRMDWGIEPSYAKAVNDEQIEQGKHINGLVVFRKRSKINSSYPIPKRLQLRENEKGEAEDTLYITTYADVDRYETLVSYAHELRREYIIQRLD